MHKHRPAYQTYKEAQPYRTYLPYLPTIFAVPTIFAIATVSTARAVLTVSTARTLTQFWKNGEVRKNPDVNPSLQYRNSGKAPKLR